MFGVHDFLGRHRREATDRAVALKRESDLGDPYRDDPARHPALVVQKAKPLRKHPCSASLLAPSGARAAGNANLGHATLLSCLSIKWCATHTAAASAFVIERGS